MTPYVKDWEENRREEIKELTGRGILPAYHDIQKREKNGEEVDRSEVQYWLMGQAAGAVNSIETAADIINEMVDGAIDIMRNNVSIISRI